MNWFRKILLKERKKRALTEVRTDIRFIERYRSQWLNYDESEARSELRKQRALPEKKQDEEKVKKLSMEIARQQATKKEYEDLRGLEADLLLYIQLI